MKTYWDYEERERAELSEEDVRKLLDFELMEKGVLQVTAPKLEPLVEVALPKTRLCGIKHESGRYGGTVKLDVLFGSLEAAESFLRLAPLVRHHDYEAGASFSKPLFAAAIEPEDVAAEQDVMNAISVLRSNKAAKERNDKAALEYEAAVREMARAGQGVWDDWYACRANKARNQKVMDTLAEYERLAGDRATARAFLGKVFKVAEILAAFEWFGRPPEPIPPPPATPVRPNESVEPMGSTGPDLPF